MTEGIDGKFKIATGSNFTYALANELGLSREERNKLGSVWNKIYQECGGVENLNHVKADQEFVLGEDSMKKILGWVNEKLGKDLKLTEPEDAQVKEAPVDEVPAEETPVKEVPAEEQPDVTGSIAKLEQIKSNAEELRAAVEKAIGRDDLEDFAGADNWFRDDIEDFDSEALFYFIKDGEENAQLLLADMSNSRKLKLMKELNPEYKGVKVSNEDLINAAKGYIDKLEGNAGIEKKQAEVAQEADRQQRVEKMRDSLQVKTENINNTNQIDIDDYYLEEIISGIESKYYFVFDKLFDKNNEITDKSLTKLANNIKELLSLEVFSFDIINNKNINYIIDVNISPGFYKSDIARSYFINLIKDIKR